MSVLYSNGSVTHTFGNVACIAMEYIKKFFGEDFFKVTHISTKLAYKQLDIFKSKQEFWKLHKPMLILRPRIEMDDSSKYFYGATMMNRMHNVTSPAEYANRVELVRSDQDGVMIQFLWNRYKIYYDIVIIVETYNEYLNLKNEMINSIVPNTPFMINTPLEAYVPKSIINGVADYLNIDTSDTASIIRYLNTFSNAPFTYKYKDGSGNNEYFTLYNTNIEAIPSDISDDEGNERGMITETFTISFTLSCEFNTMAAFYLTLRDDSDKFMKCLLDSSETGKDRVVPLYSIPLLFHMDLDPGWRIATAPAYFVTSGQLPDKTSLKDAIDSQLKDVIKYQRAMNLPLDLFIKFRVYKGNKELPNSRIGYLIDLEDLDNPFILTYDIGLEDTYRVFVLVNNGYINQILSEINDFNKEK